LRAAGSSSTSDDASSYALYKPGALASQHSVDYKPANQRTNERPNIMKPYQPNDDRIVSVKKKERQLTLTIKHKDSVDKFIEFTPNG